MSNMADFLHFRAETIAEELVDINTKHLLKEAISGYGMKGRVIDLLESLKIVLFPTLYERDIKTPDHLPAIVKKELQQVAAMLSGILRDVFINSCENTERENCAHEHCEEHADMITIQFLEQLANLRRILTMDVQAAYEGDPAAQYIEEILLSYPSVEAVSIYRLAHTLYEAKVPIIPRMMAEYAHQQTGIDIHPGAKIGTHFFIDHGTGVVIGETCEIGNHVKIYQGVTLGARSFELDEAGNPVKNIKRHPNIEDNVVIYAGATILGGDVTVGHDSVIGGNVWLTESVPPYATVYHTAPAPGIRVKKK